MGDMPTSVRVGYATFTVLNWATVEAVSNGNDGECLINRRLIRIRDDLEPTRKANVLLHEILHACYSMGDLSDGCLEEKVVTVLANQMTQVWRDNPGFVEFMSASLSFNQPVE